MEVSKRAIGPLLLAHAVQDRLLPREMSKPRLRSEERLSVLTKCSSTTRLETRTKESSSYASVRVSNPYA